MSVATIQLTEFINNDLSCAEKSVWPLSITALGTNISSEIFVYQMIPVTDTLPGDRFQCVASTQQLSEVPAINHLELHPKCDEKFRCPFYRTDTVTFTCYSLTEAQDKWALIQDAVQRLIDNYNQWQNLVTKEVVVIEPI
jgi:hypothetical protein